ncbi:MAG TPA: DinB family protein [Gemmatimonadaceae bacterium]|jgi:uncharacterized damage-inducible protein DinB
MEITTIDPFLDYWKSVRGRTRRVIETIPEDRMDWSYAAGKFTFGGIIRHLATIERYMYGETVQGKPSSYPGYDRSLQQENETPLEFMDRLDAESVEIFRRLSDEDLTRKCVTPAGSSITIWKWLRAMVEHEAHHRGQLYMMLSMLGVATPPLYGLTEEEVRAKSGH